MPGIRISDKDTVSIADDVIVLSSGNVARLPIGRLSALAGVNFDTVADLLADTRLSYAAGDELTQVIPGQRIAVAGLYFSEVVAAGTAEVHVQTAGGVLMQVRAGPDGFMHFGAWGVDHTQVITATLQQAIDWSHAQGARGIILPPEEHLTDDTIYEPGVDADRGQSWSMFGYGPGEATTLWPGNDRTVIRASNPAVPVLADRLGGAETSNGGHVIGNLRLAGATNAGVPLHLVQSGGSNSKYFRITGHQTGDGDGQKVEFAFLTTMDDCFFFRGTPGSEVTDAGTGFIYEPVKDQGLVIYRLCSARGFATGFDICPATSGGYGKATELDSCQVSVCEAAVKVGTYAENTMISNLYGEKGTTPASGVFVEDEGFMTKVIGAHCSRGWAVGIRKTAAAKNPSYIGNEIIIAFAADGEGIGIELDLGNSAPCTVTGNSIEAQVGQLNAIGIQIRASFQASGGQRIAATIGACNNFKPVSAWDVNGCVRVSDETGFGLTGTWPASDEVGSVYPVTRGAVLDHEIARDETAISSNRIDIPLCNRLTLASDAAPGSINHIAFSGSRRADLKIWVRLDDDQITLTNSSRIVLRDGAAMAGPGWILFDADLRSPLRMAWDRCRAGGPSAIPRATTA